jgi:hypothetical protein
MISNGGMDRHLINNMPASIGIIICPAARRQPGGTYFRVNLAIPIVTIKDVNECLVEGVSSDDFKKYIASAKPIELDEIKRPDEYTEEVYDYYETDWSKRGWDTPWYPALPWRVRKAEFTILSGFSGSGKTVALNQLMLHLVQQGCKVMDASLEVKPGMTLYNMTRCAMAKRESNRDEISACINWLNDSVFFLDCIGTVNVKRLLAAM